MGDTTVLLTGGTGFVGRHATRALVAAGFDVHLAVRSGSPSTPAQGAAVHLLDDAVIGIGDVVRAVRPTTVVHLATLFAAEHRADQVRDMIEANVTLGTAAAEAATDVGARLVYASTAWQHFEGRAYSPVSLYAATKQAFDDVVRYYVEVRGLVAAELCLFDTYGPGDERRKLVSLLLDHAVSRAPLAMSSGTQLIDLTHVDDVVDALRLAIDGGVDGGRLVVRSGSPLPVRKLAETVARVSDRTLDITWGARPDRPREMFVDWHIDGSPTTWRPRIDLETGLRQLWQERLKRG